MDPRLYGILNSLLMNIDVLDGQLMNLLRSEQFRADDDCLHLIARIRECCGNTLQLAASLERAALTVHPSPCKK